MAARGKMPTRVIVSGAAPPFRYVRSMFIINVLTTTPFNSSSWLSHQILGAGDLVNRTALARFLALCQFKYGGIAKAPGEHPGSVIARAKNRV